MIVCIFLPAKSRQRGSGGISSERSSPEFVIFSHPNPPRNPTLLFFKSPSSDHLSFAPAIVISPFIRSFFSYLFHSYTSREAKISRDIPEFPISRLRLAIISAYVVVPYTSKATSYRTFPSTIVDPTSARCFSLAIFSSLFSSQPGKRRGAAARDPHTTPRKASPFARRSGHNEGRKGIQVMPYSMLMVCSERVKRTEITTR